jgi:quercetin dioxygenase-like cupin family protein
MNTQPLSSSVALFLPVWARRALCWGTLVVLAITPTFAKGRAKPQESTAGQSHRFFAFAEAPYHTSPDKRVGAKILIDSAKVGPTLASMVHLTFLPGAHIKSHRHVYVTEVIYVLKGNLTLRIGEEVKVMGPDATAYIPPQTFHEYLNDSSDVVQFLQYFSPSGPEEEYRNWQRPDQPPPTTTPKSAGVATEPQQVVSPPLPMVPGSPQPRIDPEIKTVQPTPAPKPPLAQPQQPAGTQHLQLQSDPPKVNPGKQGSDLRLRTGGQLTPAVPGSPTKPSVP